MQHYKITWKERQDEMEIVKNSGEFTLIIQNHEVISWMETLIKSNILGKKVHNYSISRKRVILEEGMTMTYLEDNQCVFTFWYNDELERYINEVKEMSELLDEEKQKYHVA